MTYAILDKFDLFICICALLTTIVNVAFFRNVTSTFIASFIFMMVQSCSVLLTEPLRDWISTMDINTARAMFYFGFAFIDILMVLLLYKIHIKAEIKTNFLSRFLCRCLQGMALLQVLRFIDRQYGGDWLGFVYMYTIPGANLAVASALVFFTAKEVLANIKSSGIKGV